MESSGESGSQEKGGTKERITDNDNVFLGITVSDIEIRNGELVFHLTNDTMTNKLTTTAKVMEIVIDGYRRECAVSSPEPLSASQHGTQILQWISQKLAVPSVVPMHNADCGAPIGSIGDIQAETRSDKNGKETGDAPGDISACTIIPNHPETVAIRNAFGETVALTGLSGDDGDNADIRNPTRGRKRMRINSNSSSEVESKDSPLKYGPKLDDSVNEESFSSDNSSESEEDSANSREFRNKNSFILDEAEEDNALEEELEEEELEEEEEERGEQKEELEEEEEEEEIVGDEERLTEEKKTD